MLRRRHGMKAGSAGVPPAQQWHSLTPLSHPARPATAPRFRFSRAHGVPGGRVAGRRITGKLSGHPTQRMRARRPRSRRGASSHPYWLREEALPLPMRQSRSASCAFVVLRVSSWIPLFFVCFRQGLAHFLHPARPAKTPGLCFGRAHAVPVGTVAGCRIAGKLSGTQRECMRAGRPRSRGAPPRKILAPQGGRRRLAGRHPCRCGRALTLGGPSWSFV